MRVESSDIVEWEGADHIFDLNQDDPGRAGRLASMPSSRPAPSCRSSICRRCSRISTGCSSRVVASSTVRCRPTTTWTSASTCCVRTSSATSTPPTGGEIEANYLCEYYAYWHGGRLHSDTWKVYEYQQGCLDPLSYGRYGASAGGRVHGGPQDRPESTGDVIPQLGQYRQTWDEFSAKGGGPEAVAGLKDADAAGAAESASPAMLRLTLPFKRVMETVRRRFLPRKMPPVVMRL